MRPLAKKLLIAATSATVTALAAWTYLPARSAGPETIVLVDNTAEMTELLERRAREAGPGADWRATGGSYPPPLVREHIPKELAKEKFYGALRRKSDYRFQRDAHVWALTNRDIRVPFPEHPDGGWTTHTNRLGLRKDVEVLDPPPDVRVLVVGDSHTAGLVPNPEAFPNLLETLLREAHPERTWEGLNAGVGGTNPYNFLGVLEYLQPVLHPQVLVVAIYGGNDFQGLLALHRYYNRLGAPRFGLRRAPVLRALPGRGAVGQVLGQVAYFLDNPGDVGLAQAALDTLSVEFERQCEAAGIGLIFVYLPPGTSVHPERYDDLLDEPLAKLEITRDQLAVADELAANWLSFLEQRGLTAIDMSPIFRASAEACYWHTDLHVNTHGHRLIAEALLPVIANLAR